jgi:hypothetical protein
MKRKILSVVLMVIMYGCVSPEVKQARQEEPARLEEQRQAEEERKRALQEEQFI